MKARVYITLKSGVLDTQGRAVQKTLGALGFDEVTDVRIGKYIELELDDPGDRSADSDPRARLIAMCDKLLANPVIEDYRLEIDGAVDEKPPTEEPTS